MKKVVLLISTLLFVFGCTMDEKLGGPADLQYLVLSKTNIPSDGTQQIDLVKNVGRVTLIPDDELDDPNPKKYAYTYSGIKRKLIVRNSTATTQNYTFNLKFNEHNVFFISPARDRKTGEILKDESCFLEDVPFLTAIPTVKLASQKSCTFDVFATPNSSSQLRRINLNDTYNFVTDAQFKGKGKYEARLSVESENSLNEYNLSVTMIESLPIIMDNNDNTSTVTGSVDFGYASVNSNRLKEFVTCPDNENQLCLPFVAVINDDISDSLTLDYQRNFGTAFGVNDRSTCRQVEHKKNDEFVTSLDKAYLPCMIIFQFWPRHTINYEKYFTFQTPTKSFTINMKGNTDNKTQQPPSIQISDGSTVGDLVPQKYIKFKGIDFSNLLDEDGNISIPNMFKELVRFERKYIMFYPQVWKESDGRTLTVPYEVKFLNIADTASFVDSGFIILLPSIIEYINNKMKFLIVPDNITTGTEGSSVSEERGIKTVVDAKEVIAYPCLPLQSSVIVNRVCYVQVAFLANVFNNMYSLNDNFTRSKTYEYLLETDVGSIPLFAKYVSPCDMLGLPNNGLCKVSDDFPSDIRPKDSMRDFVEQSPSYEGSLFIGSVTDRNNDNVTTYRDIVVSSSAKSQQYSMRFMNTTSSFYFEQDNDTQTACKLANNNERKISFVLEANEVNRSCTYLIKFNYPGVDEVYQTYGGYFDMIEVIIDGKKHYTPVYASVLDSLPSPDPRVETVGDNTTLFYTIPFERTFKDTYSKSMFALKVHKPDDDTKLSMKFDTNFSNAFRIMSQTTCNVNYTRSKLAINNFPDPNKLRKDYCLVVISAIPPNTEIVNKATLTLTKEYTDPLTDEVTATSHAYKFTSVGQVQDLNGQITNTIKTSTSEQ